MKKLTSFEQWISTNKIQLEGQRSEKPNESLTIKKEVSNDHNEMIKNNLHDILDYATDLLGLVDSNSELEEWMESKITIARTYMSDVTHAYMNQIRNQEDQGCDF